MLGSHLWKWQSFEPKYGHNNIYIYIYIQKGLSQNGLSQNGYGYIYIYTLFVYIYIHIYLERDIHMYYKSLSRSIYIYVNIYIYTLIRISTYVYMYMCLSFGALHIPWRPNSSNQIHFTSNDYDSHIGKIDLATSLTKSRYVFATCLRMYALRIRHTFAYIYIWIYQLYDFCNYFCNYIYMCVYLSIYIIYIYICIYIYIYEYTCSKLSIWIDTCVGHMHLIAILIYSFDLLCCLLPMASCLLPIVYRLKHVQNMFFEFRINVPIDFGAGVATPTFASNYVWVGSLSPKTCRTNVLSQMSRQTQNMFSSCFYPVFWSSQVCVRRCFGSFVNAFIWGCGS